MGRGPMRWRGSGEGEGTAHALGTPGGGKEGPRGDGDDALLEARRSGTAPPADGRGEGAEGRRREGD